MTWAERDNSGLPLWLGQPPDWEQRYVMLDTFVALVILAATAVLLEWRIRRRANPQSEI